MLRPLVLSLALATAVSAQTTPIARTPDGQPDIQGYWTEAPGGPEAVNVENGFQTADSLRVQGWTEARLAARVPVSAISLVFYRHTEPNVRLLDYECYAFALDDVPNVPTN